MCVTLILIKSLFKSHVNRLSLILDLDIQENWFGWLKVNLGYCQTFFLAIILSNIQSNQTLTGAEGSIHEFMLFWDQVNCTCNINCGHVDKDQDPCELYWNSWYGNKSFCCQCLKQENPSHGWWESFVGPGCALDSDKFFIICCNNLGGCYGSRFVWTGSDFSVIKSNMFYYFGQPVMQTV